MAKTKGLCRDKRGLFVRNLGWKQTDKGYAQQKFYLGRDETKAKIASLKLEQLWDVVCKRWKQETLPTTHVKYDDSQQSIVTVDGCVTFLTVGFGKTELVYEGKPVWDEVSLTIAEAIRKGEVAVQVPMPGPGKRSDFMSLSVGHWLNRLRRDVPFIHIELHDLERHQEAEAQIREEGIRLIAKGQSMVRQSVGGETLHEALTAYAKAVRKKHRNLDGTVNPTGTTQVRQVEFLKDTFADCQLADLDAAKVHTLQDTLALRPPGKRVKRIAPRTARNCIKQLRHFIRWLNMAPEFSWKRPADLELTSIRVLETPEEKSVLARKPRVQTYSMDEIGVLWAYATPLKRLLLLLGLNCGFDAKMIATLQPEDVHLHQKHPHAGEVSYPIADDESWIFRLRNKTSVYGEWKLWPITVRAIEWWRRQREQIEVAEGVTAFFVNQRGRAYDTPTANNDRNPQIPNLWNGLTQTIRNDEEHKEFRKLSFGKLRKTAGNLIRNAGDGEIAGIFLCHGQPVKSDELLDFYTNRPFAKVFETIDRVGQQLSPIWSSISDPFPERRKRGGNNISAGKIRRIQKLRQQGYKVAYIAQKTGVSRQTVIRHSSTKGH